MQGGLNCPAAVLNMRGRFGLVPAVPSFDFYRLSR